MQMKFTKKLIEELSCTAGQVRFYVRDEQCRGLRLEVRSTGGKTYYYTYRDHRGKQRSYKLANAADVSPAQARLLCERARSKIAMGTDIVEERKQFRQATTLAEFYATSFLPYIQGYKRSWQTDVSVFQNHILPVLGNLYLDAITPADVGVVMTRARERLADSTCNRLLILLRYTFNLAIRWQVVGVTVNPTRTHQLKKVSHYRERFLTAPETERLLMFVNRSSNRMLKYIIPMLLLTGARKREVLDARWVDMDIERRFWRIPRTKSGRERYVPLSDAAIELLSRVPRREHVEYIFANHRTHQPFGCVYRSWNRARTLAGMPELHVHDLRHSFASFLVNAGCSLYEVQKILGHASITMTQRCSHLSLDSLLKAVSHAERFVVPPPGDQTMIGAISSS